MNPYNFLIPRLNADEIDEGFDYYSDLVRRGIAGFIVFGGEMESLRAGIGRLQRLSDHPLIIASDLEAGLGQQVRGGTLFPPAMAIARAYNRMEDEEGNSCLKRIYSSIASEALYAGINTILAPVLDINSNPENPIIATRSFGEDPNTVSYFGTSMIKVYKKMGVLCCGKHFPGHGDTDRDSHQELPVINRDLSELEGYELIPFKEAIASGVDMVMLGHLSVPCLDPSGRPATVSPEVVSYLRDVMGFKGLIITDAMNMGGISGYSEEEASFLALVAGVDLILHPSDPHSVAEYIDSRLEAKGSRLEDIYNTLQPLACNLQPDLQSNRELARELFYRAITARGDIRSVKNPFLITMTDGDGFNSYFLDWFKGTFGGERVLLLDEPLIPASRIPEGSDLVVSIFSEARAWKKKTLNIRELVSKFDKRVKFFLSFGNPYILHRVDSPVIFTYSTSEEAQVAMIRYIRERGLFK